MKTAAIYARVSSAKQKEENTIASQTAALIAFAAEQGYAVPAEWIFEDEGYSGASLIRPGLERVRDLAAEGQLDAVLIWHSIPLRAGPSGSHDPCVLPARRPSDGVDI